MRIRSRWASSSLPAARARQALGAAPPRWRRWRRSHAARRRRRSGWPGRRRARRPRRPPRRSARRSGMSRSTSSPNISIADRESPRRRDGSRWCRRAPGRCPGRGSWSLRAYCMSTSAAQQGPLVVDLAQVEAEDPVLVLLGRAEAVDARHRGHHDDVPAGQQRLRRRVPQPVDLVVDRRVLLDVGVGRRDVRLGLVVVVVRDEVLDRGCRGRTRAAPLASWAASDLFGSMTRVGRWTCSIIQAIVAVLPVPVIPSSVWKRSPRFDALGQLGDGLRLVTRGREVGDDPEGWHRVIVTTRCSARSRPGRTRRAKDHHGEEIPPDGVPVDVRSGRPAQTLRTTTSPGGFDRVHGTTSSASRLTRT